MKPWLLVVNLLCIVALFASVIWAGFAIGRHDQFQDRIMVVFELQGVCLGFMVFRRLARRR